MISYADLLSRMSEAKGEESDEPLLDSGEESRAMEAIRNGMNLRKPECGDFWEDFITVIGNADAMAELLEVPTEKITGWASRVREYLDKIKDADSDSDSAEKAEMVPTGNEGPTLDQENQPPTNLNPDPS